MKWLEWFLGTVDLPDGTYYYTFDDGQGEMYSALYRYNDRNIFIEKPPQKRQPL
ncbi:MAG: hypothetical protein R2784_02160 [Saprospiraceae bacterium]